MCPTTSTWSPPETALSLEVVEVGVGNIVLSGVCVCVVVFVLWSVLFVLFMVPMFVITGRLSVGTETVGVHALCLFVVRFMFFGGGSRGGGSSGFFGATVPQIVSPTVRGGPWAPPPRFVFL